MNSGTPDMSTKSDEQWEIESDADAITRAQKVRRNKKRWPKVQAELVKRAKEANAAVVEAGAKKGLKKAFPEDK